MKNKTKQIIKVFKLLHGLSPKIIPITLAKSFFQAVTPFVAIIASSVIIDKLASGSPLNEILFVAAIAVLVNITVILLGGFFNKQNEIQCYFSEEQLSIALATKILDADYAQVENPKTHLLKEKIDMDSRTFGGIWNVFFQIDSIFKNIISIISSCAVLFSGVFQVNKAITGEYSWINSPWLLVVLVAVILFSIAFTSIFGVKQMKAEFVEVDKLVNGNREFGFFSDLVENYKTGKDIRIFNVTPIIKNVVHGEWGKKSGVTFKRMCKIEGSDIGVTGLFSAISSGLIYIFIGLKAWLGIFSIGSVIRYSGAVYELTQNFTYMIRELVNLQLMCDRLQNVFDFLELPNEQHHGTLPVEKRRDNEYAIEFKNVSFKYPGSETYSLKNLNLKLTIGKRLAVVGMNGSGKTTMIKLLTRLYDPTEGEITLNGIDIRKYDYTEYMGIFSVVFQDFKLFSFSLGQNVASSVEYDKLMVEQCLNEAGFSERFGKMPKGLETCLYKDFEEDGVEISGGEAQKIALARALYKNAPFIILDEPTAALDPIAEFEIYSKFNEIVGNKTAVYISHRLSSCRFCDDIAVFHEGKLIQRGSHDKLILDKEGKYYELWTAQSQYYTA